MKAMDMVDVMTSISARESKIASLCTSARDALENMEPMPEGDARKWATVCMDLIGVMEDQLSLLLDDIRQAEKMAMIDSLLADGVLHEGREIKTA